MIRRLLIANRGEIAARIARTARRMGVETVAVFSEADRDAPHVAACDHAAAIGPAPAAESYLAADRLLAAARATGADAVHPGYGFLSENPAFAEAVIGAGLVWVGPPPAAIRAMGLKDEAKRRMEAAGVPVVPGYHGGAQDDARLADEAARIGYPVLVKASAGGGGKGMRRVDRAEDLPEALARARSEAASAFGDPAVLIERLVANPRHIEVQVFADGAGRTVHLYERDCSAQRRHQKVIEEAPAPGMTAALRAAMTGAAVRAAEAVGYVGAGTVEFIVDGARMTPDAFFFLEMNTRLQVEHPVTEAVTGLDLVEWQLRVAAGEPLPLAQEAVGLRGHAVEARLYAEDPAEGFRPATGRIAALAWPASARVDAGVRAGDRVGPHYDPMLAKLVVHAPTRTAAFARLAEALADTHLAGVTTNLAFLERLAADADMVAGRVDTGLIDRRIAALAAPPEPTAADLALGAAALGGQLAPGPVAFWRPWGAGRSHATLETGGAPATVGYGVRAEGGGIAIEAEIARDGGQERVRLSARAAGGALWQVAEGDAPARPMRLHRDPGGVTIARDGARLRLAMRDPVAAAEAETGSADSLAAPLPGLVRAVAAEPGARVRRGAPLVVLEAMKMEHSLAAPRDGIVAEVLAGVGEHVAEGAVLVRLAPEESP